MEFLHTLLYTFPKVLTRRICIRASLVGDHFLYSCNLFEEILFICALVVSFAALALRAQEKRSARAANDTTRVQINNNSEKNHVIIIVINKQGQMTFCSLKEIRCLA